MRFPATSCRLPDPNRVSRFLSHFFADRRLFSENTAVVTNPTRGAFFARNRTGSNQAVLRFPAHPGRSASYALQASCLSLPREPHAGCRDRKAVKSAAEKAAEISTIERQKNIGRCQRAEENRPVLLHRKYGGLVDRQDIIDDNELAPQPRPRCGDRCRESREVAGCLRDGRGRRHQELIIRSCKAEHRPGCLFRPTRRRQSRRLNPETASRLLSQAAPIRLIFRDPPSHLFRREHAGLWKHRPFSPKPRSQEKHSLLLLSRRERNGRGLYIIECHHTNERIPIEGDLQRPRLTENRASAKSRRAQYRRRYSRL